MQKIPTLFVRDPDDMSRVTDEVREDCGWVLLGEGVATRKYDGWCCKVDPDGSFWKRAEVKRGRLPQPEFVEVERDEVTGKRVGWVPVGEGPEDRWFREAYERSRHGIQPPLPQPRPLPGTYELCGPKVQGNPEGFSAHLLISHAGAQELPDCPVDVDGIKKFVASLPHEGVVWHHPDGRMAKLKARDLRERRAV